MRVKIGRYPHHFDTKDLLYRYLDWKYGVSEWLFFGDEGERDYDSVDQIVIHSLKGVDWILDKCVNRFIDRSKKPKHRVRIDPHDTISLDYTLGVIILPALREFRERSDSLVMVDPADTPESLKPPEGEFDAFGDDANAQARWNWVLDEMIWAFECIVDDSWQDQYHTGQMDLRFEKTDDGKYHRMVHGPNHTHQFDQVGYEKHNERIDRGLRLFGKYYRGLWN